MAGPYALCLRTVLLALWITLLPLHLATASPPEGDADHPEIILIDQAQALITVQGHAELSLVALPYHWDRQQPGQPGQASFEMAFSLPNEPATPFAALLPVVGNRFEIWLNGTLLSQNGELNAQASADFAKIPRYVAIPPQLLQKNNLLRIHISADAGRSGGLSAVRVGSEKQIRSLYDSSYRTLVAGVLAVLIVLLLAGLLAAALWWTQPSALVGRQPTPGAAVQRDRLYGYAALATLGWALYLADRLTEHPPLPWPAWQALMALAAGTALLATLLLSVHLLRRAHPLWLRSLMAGSLLCIVLALASELWQQHSSQQLEASAWPRYAYALLGMTVLGTVIHRFRAASAQARELLHTLEQRVADKERALAASYQQLELLAREQERNLERTRILRDMHDGVGSHISAAIRQLQSGQATDGQVLTTLRDSLDQLKLSIDSMHLVAGDVTALLANLRYRLEPRFTSSGMVFEWDVDLLPPIARLDHSAMRQLQYMLFEALSNVLQHAKARTVRIEARVQGAAAMVRVIDDGCGFDTQATSLRGLASMRERAAAIGAQLDIQSAAGRTVVAMLV
ncbi:MAG: ATP-binding protein [Burkholderiaceae bacterium]